nr:uncharacterized protein LOC6627966 isoform X4 [Drosophila virilis]
MMPKHIRFPIRTIFLLIIFFIILTYCSFLFLKSSNVMPSKPQPFILRNLDYGYLDNSSETSERLHPKKILKIMQRIHTANKQQLILNANKYGPLENDSVVIVIQVHKRINYLKYLVNSLSHAKDISKVLLVFSHDVYDKEINDYVQAIDFCMVIQIFYPHSLQTHPHTFPGKDPNDCPRNITKDESCIVLGGRSLRIRRLFICIDADANEYQKRVCTLQYFVSRQLPERIYSQIVPRKG